MLKIKVSGSHPQDDAVTSWTYTLTEYANWCIRGIERGYKPRELSNGIALFESIDPDHDLVFTARIVEEA